MKPYKYLHHTADAKFQAYGKTLEEAFSNATLATSGVMVDVKKVKPITSKKISLEAKKLRQLFYDYIQELVILTDTDGFLASKVKSLKISGSDKKGYKLKAELLGDHYTNYETHSPIKSMTYSDILVEKRRLKYVVQAVVDI